MGKSRDKKWRAKVPLVVACLLALSLAAGYHVGRATSTNWNSEKTAFLYACRASHRVKGASDGTLLQLSLPASTYRFDGNDVHEIPNALALAHEHYPVLSAEEYDSWLDGIAAFGAGAASKAAWDAAVDSSEAKVLQRVLAEERVLLSIVTVGAFGAGYAVGHRFEANFDAPEFRKALGDKNEWKKIWSTKVQLAQTKLNMDETAKNLQVLKDSGTPEDDKTRRLKKQLDKEYALLARADPDLFR